MKYVKNYDRFINESKTKVNTYSPDLVNVDLTKDELDSYVPSDYDKEYNEYGTKKSSEWDVDNFVSYVSDRMNSKDNVSINEPLLKAIFKKTFNVLDLNIDGSGYNGNKFFKKYKNWRSALYDIWTEILSKHKASNEEAKTDVVDDKKINTVLKHYIIAALWSTSNMDDDSKFLDQDYSEEDIAPETLEKMKADVTKFLNDNIEALNKSGLSDELIGHDFWLSRNGHGAGFFDHNLDKDVEKQLMDYCRDMKGVDLYVGDDNKIHA